MIGADWNGDASSSLATAPNELGIMAAFERALLAASRCGLPAIAERSTAADTLVGGGGAGGKMLPTNPVGGVAKDAARATIR